MTRRYITRESAYWDMLVELNVALLLQCEPGSELYNQLLHTLDLVRELSRVQLENARAASEASTQATGCGGRGGGSGGRGGARGHRGGRGPAPVPVRSSEDKHESAIGTCTWMVLGHRDARLTLLPSHPTPLAMTIVQNSAPKLKPALDPHYPLGCLPHWSVALPMMVAIYLYQHLAKRPHL